MYSFSGPEHIFSSNSKHCSKKSFMPNSSYLFVFLFHFIFVFRIIFCVFRKSRSLCDIFWSKFFLLIPWPWTNQNRFIHSNNSFWYWYSWIWYIDFFVNFFFVGFFFGYFVSLNNTNPAKSIPCEKIVVYSIFNLFIFSYVMTVI